MPSICLEEEGEGKETRKKKHEEKQEALVIQWFRSQIWHKFSKGTFVAFGAKIWQLKMSFLEDTHTGDLKLKVTNLLLVMDGYSPGLALDVCF